MVSSSALNKSQLIDSWLRNLAANKVKRVATARIEGLRKSGGTFRFTAQVKLERRKFDRIVVQRRAGNFTPLRDNEDIISIEW